MKHYHRRADDTTAPDSTHNAISRSISDCIWTNAPTREIDLAILWLRNIASDCDFKIHRLERLKADRERARDYKRAKDDLTRDFDDPDFLGIDENNQLAIIRQRLGCDMERAAQLRALIVPKLKQRLRSARNTQIMQLHQSGHAPQKIAAQVGLTRQQVHNVIKERKKPLF